MATGQATGDAVGGSVIHASTVALDGRALLILGAAGSGKSTLALGLMALGCTLVADDRTQLCVAEGRVIAAPPSTLAARRS